MAEHSVQIDVDAPADQVWGLVGDFEGLGSWFPGIDGTTIEGDVRVLDTMGIQIREQLLELDAEGRVLVYSVIEGAPVEQHRATVSVSERDGGSSVEWRVEVEPAEMLPLFVDVYQKALEELQRQVTS